MADLGKYGNPQDLAAVNQSIDEGQQRFAAEQERTNGNQSLIRMYRNLWDQAMGEHQATRDLLHQKWIDAINTDESGGTVQDPTNVPNTQVLLGQDESSSAGTSNAVGSSNAITSSGAGQQDVGGSVPAQYNDKELSPAEANAACGPAAAVAFSKAYGRNPTLKEAVELAKGVGWNTQGGMNGIANEKALMDKLGVPSHIDDRGTPDWNKVAQDANSGNPVIVSTPQHYFVVDGFAAGKFHVGNSGTAVQKLGGSEWMTPGQISSAGRGVNGVLYMDHPLSSNPSSMAQEIQSASA